MPSWYYYDPHNDSSHDSDSDSSGSSSQSNIRSRNHIQWMAAIRGTSLPDSLDCNEGRWAAIRGIRCHYKFATSDAVEDLCTLYPELARARNARLIMSNQVPEPHQLEDPSHVPYCIWYPDFAQEETYREVARRYPSLRYQVGRACAAAGYVSLYQELDLLSDVSIAEEARESGADGAQEIYNIIMASPIRYAVMNDLHRSLHPHTKTPAYLNGDTVVRWMLEARYHVCLALPIYPDIEEDGSVGEEKVELPHWRYQYTYKEAKLLFTPLPLDLPTMKKDLLIQMAAYEGNFDRYARLMRPGYMQDEELHCVVRGIYHNTMFARWWAEQLKVNRDRIRLRGNSQEAIWMISQAVNARRVMINDI
ncbi:hypothetical protein EYZ11_000313 [Aspergillus tanneri]|uniref:Uncharacterized protein n=1 Tax=Aspergillus tanneri TaxID=1220188 RepID=A0A4S3JXK6_9EURO|nr:uncharacterized protein ATNIH1004_007895 [Aspergillus tanneri]KAA8646462.1 hypothetical protein ATNIH1004_007895 [Aspergillus tanneri]THD00263.1 hypothetical protein EYZ11_000313 [Aspergillus tanneri]